MNTATYEMFREVGFDEKQAVVLATAIPDVERPIVELRSDMELRFTELELQFRQRSTHPDCVAGQPDHS